jgi:hypothetical protein
MISSKTIFLCLNKFEATITKALKFTRYSVTNVHTDYITDQVEPFTAFTYYQM